MSNQSQTGELTQSIHKVLLAPDVDWQTLIFEAACSKGLHKWMVNANWLLMGDIGVPTTSDLEAEVEAFVKDLVGNENKLFRETLVARIRNDVK